MQHFLVLLVIFILALFQGTFLPYNLVLLSVLFWAIFRPKENVFLVAFFAGLLLDLSISTPLGTSALFFLIAVGWQRLYSSRFDSSHPLFLPAFVAFVSLLFDRLVKGFWSPLASLILFVIAMALRVTFTAWFGQAEKQLKLR